MRIEVISQRRSLIIDWLPNFLVRVVRVMQSIFVVLSFLQRLFEDSENLWLTVVMRVRVMMLFVHVSVDVIRILLCGYNSQREGRSEMRFHFNNFYKSH